MTATEEQACVVQPLPRPVPSSEDDDLKRVPMQCVLCEKTAYRDMRYECTAVKFSLREIIRGNCDAMGLFQLKCKFCEKHLITHRVLVEDDALYVDA